MYTLKEHAQLLISPTSYTGVRITEGVYDSGEKFTDKIPWYPTGSMIKSQLECETRKTKERWKGSVFFELSPTKPDSKDNTQLEDNVEGDISVTPVEEQKLNQFVDIKGWTDWNGSPTFVLSRPANLQLPAGNSYATTECRFRTSYGGMKQKE